MPKTMKLSDYKKIAKVGDKVTTNFCFCAQAANGEQAIVTGVFDEVLYINGYLHYWDDLEEIRITLFSDEPKTLYNLEVGDKVDWGDKIMVRKILDKGTNPIYLLEWEDGSVAVWSAKIMETKNFKIIFTFPAITKAEAERGLGKKIIDN